ncbi:MAG TPA: protein translocase subunit SecD, partial [Alphaproteobacteria bacterium]
MVYLSRWYVIVTALFCVLGMLYAAPNLVDRQTADSLPGWVPHKQISLGLDLQGGSHLLLEVDVRAVIRERANAMVDEVRNVLRRANIGYTGLGVDGNGAAFTVREAADVDRAREAVRRLDPDTTVTVQGNRVLLSFTDRAVADRRSAAVDQSIEIVRRRIDETGVREPTIQRQGTDRILVQLPGIDDPERMKQLIGKTAKMNFQMVDVTVSPLDVCPGRPPPA